LLLRRLSIAAWSRRADYSSILENIAAAIFLCLKIKGVRVNIRYCILTLTPFYRRRIDM
jgi:hypothetical protein